MANYRTIKELSKYKGYRIRRLHKDGLWYYFAGTSDYELDAETIKARSLKDIKKIIDNMECYEFSVLLCGGYTNGTIKIYASDEDTACGKALEYVGETLNKAFPELDIEYCVEFV